MKTNWCTLIWIVLVWSGRPCGAQEHPPTPPVKSKDSVTVTATLTPEEKEDWKINEVYQPIFSLEEKRDCETAIKRYQTEVIPLADQSKFDVAKAKFLFLANRGIGSCYMAEQRYDLAEQYFRKDMDYLPTWPGVEDSDYPISFQQIALSQIGQQHWAAAEESLKKSLSLFDPRIEKALKSDDKLIRTEEGGMLLRWKARSLGYLAIVYLREGRIPESLTTVELAYGVAIQPSVPSASLNEVVKIGQSIAQASGDEDAKAKWSQRASGQK